MKNRYCGRTELTNQGFNWLEELKAYRETGLTPEEIVKLKSIKNYADAVEEQLLKYIQEEKEGRLVAVPPNDPLTLEELREMDGELVWVVQPRDVLPPFCGIVDTKDGTVANHKYCAILEDYDTEWIAYRRKPEEREGGNREEAQRENPAGTKN